MSGRTNDPTKVSSYLCNYFIYLLGGKFFDSTTFEYRGVIN